MKGFWENIVAEFTMVPQTVYEVLLSLSIIGTAFLIALCGKKAARYIIQLLLVEYVFLIYGLTVIFRNVKPNVRHFLKPFWSYISFLQGNDALLYEIIMNVVLFIPIGFLWGTQVSKGLREQQWLITFLLGIGLSLGIELMQLVFKKGSFEVDDLINNTLGCLIGFFIWRTLSKLIDAIKCKIKSKGLKTES